MLWLPSSSVNFHSFPFGVDLIWVKEFRFNFLEYNNVSRFSQNLLNRILVLFPILPFFHFKFYIRKLLFLSVSLCLFYGEPLIYFVSCSSDYLFFVGSREQLIDAIFKSFWGEFMCVRWCIWFLQGKVFFILWWFFLDHIAVLREVSWEHGEGLW
jgi:hypothetical protein